MKFMCPKCLKVTDIEPRGPEYEIVSVYCLHPNQRVDGGSEPIQMQPLPELISTIREPVTTH